MLKNILISFPLQQKALYYISDRDLYNFLGGNLT